MPIKYKTADGQEIEVELTEEQLAAIRKTEQDAGFARGRVVQTNRLLGKLGIKSDPEMAGDVDTAAGLIAEKFKPTEKKPADETDPGGGNGTLSREEVARMLAKQRDELTGDIRKKDAAVVRADLRGAARALKFRPADLDLAIDAFDRMFEAEVDSNGSAIFKSKSTGEHVTNEAGELAGPEDVMALVAKRHSGLLEPNAIPMPGRGAGAGGGVKAAPLDLREDTDALLDKAVAVRIQAGADYGKA